MNIDHRLDLYNSIDEFLGKVTEKDSLIPHYVNIERCVGGDMCNDFLYIFLFFLFGIIASFLPLILFVYLPDSSSKKNQ